MIHYFKSKMEAIIDRGTKVPHEQFAQYVYRPACGTGLISPIRMVEEKIGNDEKGADMKLWSKNASLGEVSGL